MLTLLSPAKSFDLNTPLPIAHYSIPRMLDQSNILITTALQLSSDELMDLMKISSSLAQLNYQRYLDFTTPFTPHNARPALLSFNGDVYQGISARTRFNDTNYVEASNTLRILSGLYGVLRPLDLIQPYRLEMGTRLANPRGKNLSEFWGSRITELLKQDLAESPGADAIINLASHEYSSTVNFADLDAQVISPRFENRDRSGNWRVVSFSAKRARGEMAAWIITNQVRSVAEITSFNTAGYRYQPKESTLETPVFRRETAA